MNANAEIIAELRRVLNERDEAREQLDLTKRELGRWVDREAKAVRERDQARDKHEALAVLVDGYRRERDEARATIAQIRRVFGNAIAFDDARGDIVKMAEIAYRGACDGDKAVGELQRVERERDEARAEVERLREMAHDFEAMREDRDEARAERDAAIARITEVGVMIATNGNRLAKDAYRRGAEAMREACAVALMSDGLVLSRERAANVVRALPIPEEP